MSFFNTALSRRSYEAAGKIIAYSIVHCGPLPRFISPALYAYMCEEEPIIAIDDIDDPDMRQKVKAVSRIYLLIINLL